MTSMAQLQKENARLQQMIAEHDAKVVALKTDIARYKNYISLLEEQCKLAAMKRYGASSEKVSPQQLGLFNEAESLDAPPEETLESEQHETIEIPAHRRQRKPRVSIPNDLPREEIVYDLAEEDKFCPHDQTTLRCIGSDDHEQLDIIPAQVRVLRHKRLKYACPCCDQHIVTASKPKQAIEKSIASAGLLAFIATQKYCDALPLYRQSEMFNRIGIKLDRTNLANWMVRMGELSQPLIDRLQRHIQQQPLVHMDETPIQVLKEPDKAAQSKSYMWLLACYGDQAASLYQYDPSRTGSVPMMMLADGNQVLMVDGYAGYGPACEQYRIKRLGCWAHARRQFVEAQKVKGKASKADVFIKLIQALYKIEKQSQGKPPNERYALRQEKAKPLLDKLQTQLNKLRPGITPKSKLGKALTYLHNQWQPLVRYVEDGNYPIDNNPAERSIRPFTIGRKNWMFANSQAGAKASANLYSLVETAKANGLNPYEYLKHLFTELPKATTDADLDQCLPWSIQLA